MLDHHKSFRYDPVLHILAYNRPLDNGFYGPTFLMPIQKNKINVKLHFHLVYLHDSCLPLLFRLICCHGSYRGYSVLSMVLDTRKLLRNQVGFQVVPTV